MDRAELTAALKSEARRLGFDLVGATAATPTPDFDHLRRWLSDGCAGEMPYFMRRLEAYREPAGVLAGARSVLMLGLNYRTVEPCEPAGGQGRVSRFAWGADYHDLVGERLHELADFHRRLLPSASVRGVVDTAPLLERSYARAAGLGWIGKNTTLVNRTFGSWFFLAALVTTSELQHDEPSEFDGCGSCRACLDACPTGALAGPYRLDARKCISYLTIERKGDIPAELREACGDRIFGCDACQEACPWNRETPATMLLELYPGEGMNPVSPAELSALDEAAFRRRFRHSPLWRARRRFLGPDL